MYSLRKEHCCKRKSTCKEPLLGISWKCGQRLMFLETERQMDSKKRRLYHTDGKDMLHGLRRKPQNQFYCICLLFGCVWGFQMQMLGKKLEIRLWSSTKKSGLKIYVLCSIMAKVMSLEPKCQNLNPWTTRYLLALYIWPRYYTSQVAHNIITCKVKLIMLWGLN